MIFKFKGIFCENCFFQQNNVTKILFFNILKYKSFSNHRKFQGTQNVVPRTLKTKFREKGFKYYMYGIIPVISCYLWKNNCSDIKILPTVHAATISSPRTQFNFIADIVERSADSVVAIEIKDSHRIDYFSRTHPTMTNGSGVIIQENGLILTNAHVVMGHPQSTVQVKLSDGTVYPGTVTDIDIKSDLATIRITPKRKLPVMKLGISKNLRPGEWVIAIGSPLSLSNTITAGVVSSVNRSSSELGLSGKDIAYIQTDASITYGNSGGPLVNLDGEVVGINSMKISAGISFAIPIDYIKEFLERHKNQRSARQKRYLGITMLTLNDEILRELQQRGHYVPNEINEGVVVWKLVVGSPAYSAGLHPGDIVVEINGERIKSSDVIYRCIDKCTVLNMKVFRGTKYLEVVAYPEDVS